MRRISIILLIIVLPMIGFAQPVQPTQQPNIVIILADDLGWGDVGFHGSDIQTPNLDRLAKEGIILNQFYTAPICSPTRAGLLTGRYPNRFGLRQNVIPPWSKFGVDTAEVYFPQMLGQAGYKNRAVIGKWHLGDAYKRYLPLQRGFTHFYGFYNGANDYFTHIREGELDWHNDSLVCRDTGYATDLITREAVKCINTYSGKSPFFIYVAYNAPHSPLQAKKEDLLRYAFDEDKPLIPHKGAYGMAGRGNNKHQTYAAMVTAMDRGIGDILQTLKDKRLEKNTVVLFFSDNGAAQNAGGTSGGLKGWKFQEWSGGVRSPAIIRWPAGLKEGRRTEQVMGYVDIAPTLLAMAGVKHKPKNSFDGISVLPLLDGSVDSIDRYFYLGHGAIIHSPWKLVRANRGNPAMKLKVDKLFNILADSSEKLDVKDRHLAIYEQLKSKLMPFEAIKPLHQVPPYGAGQKGFVAPKEWLITK